MAQLARVVVSGVQHQVAQRGKRRKEVLLSPDDSPTAGGQVEVTPILPALSDTCY